MHISIFDLFSIGIGPSSSHTVGPMKAAFEFIQKINHNKLHPLSQVSRVQVDTYGSLALTGKGHGTEKAILMGLSGELPDTVHPASIPQQLQQITKKHQIILNKTHPITFDIKQDFLLHKEKALPKHSNGMKLNAFNADHQLIAEETYYSIGGGFIVTDKDFGKENTGATDIKVPYSFNTATELFSHCLQHHLSIDQVMRYNEQTIHQDQEINQRLDSIAATMENCIHTGCRSDGILPGGLKVKRRAPEIYQKLQVSQKIPPKNVNHSEVMNWLNVFAMAVNEENAAGGRIVTAPTNGAAGIIPSVLEYYKRFCDGTQKGIRQFLLTAGAIAILYKKGASISGAEVGCQGEVGVACSMAAGALCAVLGGTLTQIENAAEIGMEHNLGLTCDPVAGLVQIPCIERNAMGAVKAVNAAHLALAETDSNKVSLDKVIETMKQTGADMAHHYKETSLGGLAIQVGLPEC